MAEPVVLTPDEVQSLLRSGSAERIIGARETEEVDFKSEPYRLQEEQQKFELAKDLSAFANAKGGVLALGIKTKKSEAHPWDVAAAITAFPSEMMDETRVRKVLADWLYPPLDDVVVEFYPCEIGDGASAAKGTATATLRGAVHCYEGN